MSSSTPAVATSVTIECKWEERRENEKKDVDVATVLYSRDGRLLDICCFNQLRVGGTAVVHSGDHRDGATKGADETITVDFAQLPPVVEHIVVVATLASNHTRLDDFRKLKVKIKPIGASENLLKKTKKKSRTFIPFVLSRVAGTAQFKLHEPGFEDKRHGLNRMWKLCDKVLKRLIDPVIWAERPQASYDHLKLKKNQTVMLKSPSDAVGRGKSARHDDSESGSSNDDAVLHRVVYFGLGWEVTSRDGFDLDAHCYMIDSKGSVEHIYYNCLKSKDGAVKHCGDNLTGEGKGDDERIYVDLDKVDENVTSLVFAVQCYTSGKTFRDVSGEYIRVVDSDDSVVVRCDLDSSSEFDSANAGVFCALERFGRSWRFRAICAPTTKSDLKNNDTLATLIKKSY